MANSSLFMKLDHIGVVVRDISRAMAFYQSLGVGPFEKSGTPGKDKQMHGKPLIGGKTEMRMGKMGNIGLQLMQPVDPPSVAHEYLDRNGEGINHIAFEVDNIEEVSAEIVKKGYDIVFSSKYIAGGGEIYIQSEVGDFCIQLFQPPRK